MINTIIEGDTLEVLKQMEDESVDMIITSPPYWGLRNYGVEGQIGLEDTIDEHLDVLMQIFTECKRVLADYGTLWINYGDKYVKKSFQMVPERLAIKLVDSGWVLRNKIVWHKPSVVPQSAKDRFTNDWEYIYFFSKKPKGYYFEQQFEESVYKDKKATPRKIYKSDNDVEQAGVGIFKRILSQEGFYYPPMRNCRSVWKISSQSVKDAHFATFPFKLIERPIIAGCPELVCTGKIECGQPVRKEFEHDYIKQGEFTQRKACDETKRAFKENALYNPVEEILKVGKSREQLFKELFEASSYTKKEVADKVGRSETLITFWLKDERNIGDNDWEKLKKILDIKDGCGQPVIPVIEMVKEKTKIRPESGYKRYIEGEGCTHSTVGLDEEVRIPKRTITTATHCSCGAPFRRGIVLDPFMGSGTTAIVARALDRDWVGIELNPEYIDIAHKRLEAWPKELVLKKLSNGNGHVKKVEQEDEDDFVQMELMF